MDGDLNNFIHNFFLLSSPWLINIVKYSAIWAFGDMALKAIISAVTGGEIEFSTDMFMKG